MIDPVTGGFKWGSPGSATPEGEDEVEMGEIEVLPDYPSNKNAWIGKTRKEINQLLIDNGLNPKKKWWKGLKYNDPVRAAYRSWYKSRKKSRSMKAPIAAHPEKTYTEPERKKALKKQASRLEQNIAKWKKQKQTYEKRMEKLYDKEKETSSGLPGAQSQDWFKARTDLKRVNKELRKSIRLLRARQKETGTWKEPVER
jgi:hypothetical protein